MSLFINEIFIEFILECKIFEKIIKKDAGDYYTFSADSIMKTLEKIPESEKNTDEKQMEIMVDAIKYLTLFFNINLPEYSFYYRIGYNACYLARKSLCPDLKMIITGHFQPGVKTLQSFSSSVYVDEPIRDLLFKAINISIPEE